MIYQGIVDLLAADTNVASLVNNRIYLSEIPQDAIYPCLLIHRITSTSDPTFDRKSFEEALYQIEAWADDVYSAEAVRGAVINKLFLYDGTLSEGTKLRGSFAETSLDDFDAPSYKFRRIIEFRFQYT